MPLITAMLGATRWAICARARALKLPNLCRLGLANIKPLADLAPTPIPAGAFGRCALASPGKDTTTGHWEMAGIHLEKPFPLYPHGFRRRSWMSSSGASVGARWATKRRPAPRSSKNWDGSTYGPARAIVYTSADSVFQIAAHEEVIPLWELYKICETARAILRVRTKSAV